MLATFACAIGLRSIWKFPYEVVLAAALSWVVVRTYLNR